MTLSKREAFLLFLVGAILILALMIVFLILPQQEEIAANQTRLDQLELQKLDVDTKLTLGPTYRARKDDRYQQVNDAFDEIANPLHAAEFERWMIPLIQRYSVNVSSVSLSGTSIAQQDLLVSQVSQPMYRILELIDEYNQITRDVYSPPSASTYLLKASYTYDFVTPLNRYMAILDDIKNWNTTFIVSSSSYSISDSVASITIDVYSVHKLEEQDLLDIYKGDYAFHPGDNQTPGLPEIPK